MTSRLTKAWLLADMRRRLARPPDPEGALDALRRHAASRSPHHADALAGLEAEPLYVLPVLTKDALVSDFDRIVTARGLTAQALQHHVDTAPAGSRYGRFWVGASSGSNGRPVLLPSGRREWSAKLANAARAQAIVGAASLTGPRRVARIASPSPWHLSAQVGATLSDPRRPTLRLPATTPFDELLHRLEQWEPTVLNGYASVLGTIAGAHLAGDVQLRPQRVLSGAEPLTDGARARIREAWGVEPHDQYVTTEAGFVAAECDAHDGMHVIAEDTVVEVEDDAVLVTVLASRTVPLIRYRIDDRVRVVTEPCRCGRTSPRLHVDGRARELLAIRHEGGTTRVHPVVFTQLLDRQPVERWRVVYRQGAVVVEVVGPRADFSEERVTDALRRALCEATGAAVPASVVRVDELPVGASGKATRIVVEG
jgi:phenylacetate-coenzyme A ligase PaaK-like adenylate-forming protein